ncbi:MAG: hypothetical protein J6M24_07495 [Lachnospiraceae bacterium]|nr:hypothetical protein [Lachnospiraceae bacterium]
MSSEKCILSEEALNRIKAKIIIKENKNLKDRQMNDADMVTWIKKLIEEEVRCCSNL